MRQLSRLLLAAMLGWAIPEAVHAELYEDLGGQPGVQALVDKSIQRWLADKRVGPTFSETNMDRFRRRLIEQLCQVSDGPCHYSGQSMASAHKALGLNRMQFNALAEDMQDAMTDVGIGYHTQNRLLARLAPMERDVVTK